MISFSQTSTVDSLAGTWYLTNSFPSTSDSLVYKRQSIYPMNLGDRIEFNPNYDFVDAYSGKCGNDERIHEDHGKWELAAGTIIVTSIAISIDQKSKHKILSLSTNKLVLKKIN